MTLQEETIFFNHEIPVCKIIFDFGVSFQGEDDRVGSEVLVEIILMGKLVTSELKSAINSN